MWNDNNTSNSMGENYNSEGVSIYDSIEYFATVSRSRGTDTTTYYVKNTTERGVPNPPTPTTY